LEDVRELSRGLHPAMLSRNGLGAAVKVLARKSPIPVHVEVELDPPPPEPVETAIYYVVSEALTNAIKHSRADTISVTIRGDGSTVRAAIVDDGVGGAMAGVGSGLTGLSDRVEALGGRFTLESRPESGTALTFELPRGPDVTPAAGTAGSRRSRG